MPGKLPRKDKVTDDRHPFGLPWLDCCYQETLLPNHPWHIVHDKLCKGLAIKVGKQFDVPERRQMILELLGADFVKKYFNDQPYQPSIIEPPAMSFDTRHKLQLDAQKWLQKVMEQVAAEEKCIRPFEEQSGIESCEEMKDFITATNQRFLQGMDRHLYLQQKEIEKQWLEAQWQKKDARQALRLTQQKERLRKENQRLHGTLAPRSILKNAHLTLQSSMSTDTTVSDRTITTANVKGSAIGATEDPPVFWGMQSNSLGRSVIAMLKRDPRRFTTVSRALHGRQLPGSLRAYLWLDVLLKEDRKKLNDVNIEKIVRERFGKAVARGVGELRLKRATHSTINNLINNAVIEMYDMTPGMRMHMNDDIHMKEAVKALNVLYVYDRTYEPYLIYWLFPLQLAFQTGSGESEHVYELSMYLYLLNNTCFPRWPQIYAIADHAMGRLADIDAEFYEHIKAICQRNPRVNPKDFMVHVIHEEKWKAKEIQEGENIMTTGTPEQRPSPQISHKLLTDPVIFLRKWVGEGFVGVLDTQAAVYVWDQCFLQLWENKVLEDMCLCLLMLLRYKFMAAKDYSDMKKVFFDEPCHLYTMDIQQAWLHLQKGQDPLGIPPLNRQRPRTPEPHIPLDTEGPRSPAPSLHSLQPLHPAGIKNLRLKLTFTADHLKQVKWLADFKAQNLKIVPSVYFGGIKLRSKSSTTLPVTRNVQHDKYGNITYDIHYPREKFIFDDLDPSQYDVEQEMGGYPYAVIRVDYLHEDRGTQQLATQVTLGWCRVQLYEHISQVAGSSHVEHGGQQWRLMVGDYHYTIYGGPVSQAVLLGVAKTPPDQQYAIIANNSDMGALVFDPKREPETPVLPSEEESTENAPRWPTPQSSAKESTPHTLAGGPGVKDTFDLYVDGIDNIPDSSTIVKVTGRLLSTPELSDIGDILAFPDLTTSARNPRFSYRLVVNQNQVNLDKNMLLLLKVYTVDAVDQKLTVIGSCAFDIFNKTTEKLRVGCHSRCLHHGLPAFSPKSDRLTEEMLDSFARIPAAILHFRLTEHTEHVKIVEKPNYRLHDPALNESEKKVVQSYEKDQAFPSTTNDMVQKLQTDLNDENTGKDNMLWLQDQLDKTQLGSHAAGDLPLSRLVSYRPQRGLHVQITSAYGLPDGLYVQCYARVVPGETSNGVPSSPEGFGEDAQFITKNHDYNSLQKAPVWLDREKDCHPYSDPCTYVMLQIFGLDAVYSPKPDHSSVGEVKARDGQPLTLSQHTMLGWAVVPLFDGEYTYNGIHHVPIFKKTPDADLLARLGKETPETVFSSMRWAKDTKYDGAVVVVKVWDGHFREEHLPGGLQKNGKLINAVSPSTKKGYETAEKDVKGRHISHLVVSSLEPKLRKKGTGSDVYKKEQMYYKKLMEDTFYDLMEGQLISAAMGPL